jgi:hypothetical protein
MCSYLRTQDVSLICVILQHLRDEDTRGGDEDGVADKLHYIAYIRAHWSNADVSLAL